jgi:hypothetical protein
VISQASSTWLPLGIGAPAPIPLVHQEVSMMRAENTDRQSSDPRLLSVLRHATVIWDEMDPHRVTQGAPVTKEAVAYWHRDLPPLSAELMAEHTVEASSSRVLGTLAHRDELWDQCYQELMAATNSRLVEEVARLGGHYAHVRDEAISPKHDDAAGEAWLHGTFTYMLYRRPMTA